MSRDEGDGQGATGKEHGKIFDIRTGCEELRLSGKRESCRMESLLTHGARHNAMDFPRECKLGGLFERIDGGHGTSPVGLPRVTRGWVANHPEIDALGRLR